MIALRPSTAALRASAQDDKVEGYWYSVPDMTT